SPIYSRLSSHSWLTFGRPLLPLFFFYCSRSHPDLHSFPTRRSSDLVSSIAAGRSLNGALVELARSGPDPLRMAFARFESHARMRSEEHTSELQSQSNLVCRLLLEKKKKNSQPEPVMQKQSLRPKRQS